MPCNTKYEAPTAAVTEITEQTKARQEILASGISEERLREIETFAYTLRRKFPQWSPEKIQRKVAEHFKSIKFTNKK